MDGQAGSGQIRGGGSHGELFVHHGFCKCEE